MKEITKIKKELSTLYRQLDTSQMYEDPGNYFVHKSDDLLVLGVFDAKHRIPGFYVITSSDRLGGFKDITELAGWCIDEMDCEEKLCCDTDMDSYDIRIFYDPYHWEEKYPMILEALESPELSESNFDKDLIVGFIVTPLDYHS